MSAYSQHYPTLKIKSDDGDFITSEITLNGNPIPGLKGIEISGNTLNNIFLVKLEIQASLELEIPATLKATINL